MRWGTADGWKSLKVYRWAAKRAALLVVRWVDRMDKSMAC